MAKVQTRRSVCLNRDVYRAMAKAAADADVSMSQWVETLIRERLAGLPPGKHTVLAHVRHAAERRALARELVQRMVTPPPPPRPSAEELMALRHEIARTEPGRSSRLAAHQAWERRVSNRFAAEMRKRGWLSEEGYASPDSWSAA